MTKYIDMSMKDFANELASKKSMPGGGSVSAYALIMANALASMVANFTRGKKKYAEFEEDIQDILSKFKDISGRIISKVDEDAEAFLPLAAAYQLAVQTEEQRILKEERMQECLRNAALVPIDVLNLCMEVLDLHEELLSKGSKLLISDVGVGVMMIKAAAQSAYINIFINICNIKDCEYVDKVSADADEKIENIKYRCDKIYGEVLKYVRK